MRITQQKVSVMNNYSTDFLQGQRDCKKGIPHESGKSQAYTRGFATQYTAEQTMTAMELRRGPK